jgi:acyl transferase domain-containing protein/phosphopantetheinyl transferase
MEPNTENLRSNGQGEIAITGMACLFPGAPNLRAYWENIIGKVDAVSDAPEEWNAKLFYDPNATDGERTYCKKGGFLGDLVQFDPLQFGVMPNSIDGSEPAQFLALRVAHEALVDAGYDKQLPEGAGVEVILGRAVSVDRGHLSGLQYALIVDQTLGILKQLHPEYTEEDLQAIKKELRRSLPPTGVEVIPGLVTNIITGRIANRFDFMGSNYTVDAACASSLIAVEIAMQDLRSGKCDVAVVGGVQASTPAPILMMFCQLSALSKQNKIRPFDKDADGTLLGEGVGMMVLKRRKDAEARGDRIYAILKGVGSSSDGRALGLLAPRVEGEELALRRAYELTGISPKSIGLLEAHGTGTLVGDAAEIEAVARVFGTRADSDLPTCALGSVKSMISHLIPAAGIASLIKCALSLYHRVLPPTINVETPHPELEKTCCYVNTETRPWVHGFDTPRRAGINAFGFGGINAHAILEEHPIDPTNYTVCQHRWPTELCILQAESRPELIRECERVEKFLVASSGLQLKDIAYSLNCKLMPETVRVSIVATSVSDLTEKLARTRFSLQDPKCTEIKDLAGIYYSDRPLAKEGKLAFVFPGEGSQYTNMLSDLCIHFPLVQSWFDIIERAFRQKGSKLLPSQLLFPPPLMTPTPEMEARLWDMDMGPAVVFAANQALFSLLFCMGIHPQATVGHSTGEYSALLGCGAIKWVQSGEANLIESMHSLNHVYEHCTSAELIPTGSLLVVSGGEPDLAFFALESNGDGLHLAMDNCPHQTILFGSDAAVQKAAALLRRKGAVCSEMPFGRAYHTALFQPFTEQVTRFFSNLTIVEPSCDAYSCATSGKFPRDPEQIRSLAASQWARPVRFRETIQTMHDDGVRMFLEVGPRGNLTAFVDDILSGKPHIAVPIDVRHRAGTTQLNHTLGLLAAHGIPMYLHYLYLHRAPKELSFNLPKGAEQRKSSRTVKIAMGLPLMKLPDGFSLKHRDEPSSKLNGNEPSPLTQIPAPTTALSLPPRDLQLTACQATVPELAVASSIDSFERDSTIPEITSNQSLEEDTDSMDGRTQIIQAHFRMMEEFLETQRSIMQAFLGSANGTAAADREIPAASVQPGPVLIAQTVDFSPPQAPVPNPSSAAAKPVPELVKAEKTTQIEPASETDTPIESTKPTSREELGRIFIRVIAEKTGYPVDMIEMHADLEADLGIDSIKRIEILGSFQSLTNLPRTEDMEQVAKLRTTEDIIAFVSSPKDPPVSEESNRQELGSPKPNPDTVRPHVDLPMLKEFAISSDACTLNAKICLDPQDQIFMQHHTLGEPMSQADPDLKGIPFLPLTFSLELMAEAGAALGGGSLVTRMERIRAHRWIMVQGARTDLEVTANRSEASSSKIDVKILAVNQPRAGQSGTPQPVLAEATVILGQRYTEAPNPKDLPQSVRYSSKWTRNQIYENVMFHGPSFQGLLSMDVTGEDGTEGTLQGSTREGIFQGQSHPEFLVDPVVLDLGGQVFATWAAERFTEGFHLFPFEVEGIDIFGPALEEKEEAKCRVHILQVSDAQISCDFEIIRNGKVQLRARGWRDKRVAFTEAFWHFICHYPRETVLSVPWTDAPCRFTKPDGFLCCRLLDPPVELLESSGGIWHRAVAYTILNRTERETWKNLRANEHERIEWLRGRLALKDAVRMLLHQRYGLRLAPAEIEISESDEQRPFVKAIGDPHLTHLPRIALTTIGGTVVAAAIDDDETESLALDVKRLGASSDQISFLPDEQKLFSGLDRAELEEWKMRLWCAKLATGKALGRAAIDPGQLVIKQADPMTGRVEIAFAHDSVHRTHSTNGHTWAVYTLREKDLITATSIVKSTASMQGALVA